MFQGNILPVLILALAVDGVIGDPRGIYRIVPHPAVIMGKLVGLADQFFNRPGINGGVKKLLGLAAILGLLLFWGGIGMWLSAWLASFPYGWVLLGLLMSTLVAQKSLYQHVRDVAVALEYDGLSEGRTAVAAIVGRDTGQLDEHGVSRAALESLAENYADGVVAPVFWAALFGLPGLLAYKALNTADSMIGHQNKTYADFGWAAARLDDMANWLPARLAGLLIAVAAMAHRNGAFSDGFNTLWRDARHHRSPNAGYPEAAMAGALDLRLSGPRIYDGTETTDAWIGDGRPDASPQDIRAGLRIFINACILLIVALAGWWAALLP